MEKKVSDRVNWIGAGLSLAWIAFFIVCMFIRTNFPKTQFAVDFLNGSRATWTLAGSFLVLLVLSMVISALVESSRNPGTRLSPNSEPDAES